jgi:tetratricopeptide (TPR) repeat protein
MKTSSSYCIAAIAWVAICAKRIRLLMHHCLYSHRYIKPCNTARRVWPEITAAKLLFNGAGAHYCKRLQWIFASCMFLFVFVPDLRAKNLDEAARLDEEAVALYQQGKYRDAIPLFERSLRIFEKARGARHSETVQHKTILASAYDIVGQNAKATKLLEESLAAMESSPGSENSDTADILQLLGKSYVRSGNHANAVPVLQRALAINEKALGPEHPDTGANLGHLCEAYTALAEYQKAEPLGERALAICDKVYGPDHSNTASALGIMATLYSRSGKITKAVPLCERSLEIKSKTVGPDHMQTAIAMISTAQMYQEVGDYAKAESLYKRALSITEKTLGSTSDWYATNLSLLAGIYNILGDYEKALPVFERALAISEKTCGVEDIRTAAILNNMGFVSFAVGDNPKAASLFERVLAITEKVVGADHPETATALNNLGTAYQSMGDRMKALPLCERALAIREEKQGSEHADLITSLSMLGIIHKNLGNYEKALPFYERALAICEKVFGPEHPDTSSNLNNLAVCLECMNDYPRALPLYERALKIRKDEFGPDHPATGELLVNLAQSRYEAGDESGARNYAEQAIGVLNKTLSRVLSLEEQKRSSWQKANLKFWFACIFPAESIAPLVLRWKGVILDSLVEDRALALAAKATSSSAKATARLAECRQRLSKIAFEKGNEKETEQLDNEIATLQRELTALLRGGNHQRPNLDISIDSILPALANGTSLLDFIRFRDNRLKDDAAFCYGVVVTCSDGGPTFVRIDGATAIDHAVDRLRSAINQGNVSEVEAQTKFLSEKLLQPIEAKLPEATKQLIVCPDANLNFLSFASLLGSDGRFLIEKYPIAYVGSARDLARKPLAQPTKTLALFANPAFDASVVASTTKDALAMRSAEADVFGTVKLPPLPGTEAEAKAIETVASESGWEIQSSLGQRATESAVRNATKPGVLHLATHGFYLNSFSSPPAGETRGMSVVGVSKDDQSKNQNGVDPMRASGLALSGAQQTLQSWSQRKAPDPETDGVLTAEEVGALNLDGTWLVTLSACETGVGEARSGEGVFGLRRAFMIAGAENLLMTLWPVSDETTSKIMADFYKEALVTGDAPGSLAKVQRDWLVKTREEKGLAAAIREAGPFAMVVMNNPQEKAQFQPAALRQSKAESHANTDASAPLTSSIIPSLQDALALADSGDPRAQAIASLYYGLGYKTERNLDKSKQYAIQSAKAMHAIGIYRLAEMRERGEAMQQNSKQARQLRAKAMPGLQQLSDDPFALYAIADMEKRKGSATDKIVVCLKRSAELGFAPAQAEYAQVLSNAPSSPEDLAEAERYRHLAADQGYALQAPESQHQP